MSGKENGCPERSGVVCRKHLGLYGVRRDGEIIPCSVSSKLRKHLVTGVAGPDALRREIIGVRDVKTDVVAVGDRVIFRQESGNGAVITEVLPRVNCLFRPDPGTGQDLAIAANVDQVVAVVAAAKPEPKWGLLDRYLVFGEASGIPVLICMTKMDLTQGPSLREETAVYERIGYPVLFTSAETGEGIPELRHALRGRISVLVGKSGVGKTSLLNAIEPELGMRVSSVSEFTGKGRHTTTHLEMHPLEGGGDIVDTPGIREFGVRAGTAVEDAAMLFPEMRPYLGQCRFGKNCSHSHEPGCAIKEAVEQGEIAYRRFQSYLKIV